MKHKADVKKKKAVLSAYGDDIIVIGNDEAEIELTKKFLSK